MVSFNIILPFRHAIIVLLGLKGVSMKIYKIKFIISIIFLIYVLVACNEQSNMHNDFFNNNDASEINTQNNNVVIALENENSTTNQNIFDGGSTDLPEVNHEELIAYELYRPSVTKEELIEEDYEFSVTSSGYEYTNDYVTYFFIDDMETPYAMEVFSLTPYSAPRGIEIGDSLETVLNTLPNKNGWSNDFDQSYIYGSQANSDTPPQNAVIANFYDNGIGSLSIGTEDGLPYVEFTFDDWKLIYFTYFYEFIN